MSNMTENSASKFAVRKFRKQDLGQFSRLWEAQVGKTNAIKRALYFKWLIQGNPFSEEHDDYFVIEENNRVVAYDGIMPYKFSLLGMDYAGYVYHDTLVDPNKRGQGLGSMLVNEMVNRNKLFSIAVWMNLPNARLFEKVGWKPVDKIFTYYKLYNSAPFIETKYRLVNRMMTRIMNATMLSVYKIQEIAQHNLNKNLTVNEINYFDEQVDVLFHSLRKMYRYISYRTKDVLNWKYSHKAFSECSKLTCTENGELKGYMVYRKKEDDERKKSKATIFDFLCAPDRKDIFSALLKRVILDIEKIKVDYIEILSASPIFGNILRKYGFLIKQKKPLSLKYIHSDYIDNSNRFSNGDNWFFTYGDGDNIFWHGW